MNKQSFTPETSCITDDIVRNAIKTADRAFRWLYYAGVITLVFLLSLVLNSFQ